MCQTMTDLDDKYLWLEDSDNPSTTDWVQQQTSSSTRVLQGSAVFEEIRSRLHTTLTTPSRIPAVLRRRGAWVYNFWRDDNHTHGLLRRTTVDQYGEAEPTWDPILDLDALSRLEGENWVLLGISWLEPQCSRVILQLSRGGSDAAVLREFDIESRGFVVDGFHVPESKGGSVWEDPDTLLVWNNIEKENQTSSGYARLVRRLRRGQSLRDAAAIYEGLKDDMRVSVSRDVGKHSQRTYITRQIDFFRTEILLLGEGRVTPILKPEDAAARFWKDFVIFTLRSAWITDTKTWPAGSTLIGRLAPDGGVDGELQLLFEPSGKLTLAGLSTTATRILLVVHAGTRCELRICESTDGRWNSRIAQAFDAGSVNVTPLDDQFAPEDALAESFLLSFSGPLTPETLSICDAGSDACRLLKALKPVFSSEGLVVEEREARSRDGTCIPYLIVYRAGACLDGKRPTLLYGYGGFQIAQRPVYYALQGTGWLERGGVFVVAHIRGGGEYGPEWHKAAMREKRQNAFDDFIGVAEHLIGSGVTSPAHLGIRGESNGGLLVSTVMVQRPDLFNAVLCGVPLADMRRYHKLLAGASWMAEYGNPDDPADWAYISKYSPYHNLRRDERYPPIFILTSTRDDRVHPGHARKLAARMLELGHSVKYFENSEGGHGGAADAIERAHVEAMAYTFLWNHLA